MQKAKKYSRQILVFVLAIATVLTCFFIMSPKAKADTNGVYKYKIQVQIDDSGSCSSCSLVLNYKSANGNGTASSVTVDSGTSIWNSDGTHDFEGTCAGFPTSVVAKTKLNWGLRSIKFYLICYVYDYNTEEYIRLGAGGQYSHSNSTATNTDVFTIDTSVYPYVYSDAMNAPNPVYINADGSSVTKTYDYDNNGAYLKDQYGVGWESPTWSASNGATLSSSSGRSANVTFANADNDYTAKVTASFPDTNSGTDPEAETANVTVYVPHSVVVNPNGGSYNGTTSNTTYTGKYTSDTMTIANPTRTGYDFTGWTASAGSISGTTYTVANVKTATLTANWTPHTYTASYEANGGNGTANTTYNIEAGTIAAAATRTGYTFDHWEVVSNDGNWGSAGTSYNAGASTVGKYGTVTFKPIWIANKYNVTYDNIFDFQAWKNAGISSGAGTVSDITDTGFTLTSSDSVNNDCTSNQSPLTAVQPSTTYHFSADMTTTGTNYEVYVFYYTDTSSTPCSAAPYWSNSFNSSFDFTTPANCNYIRFRVDANANGSVLTSSNFRIAPTKTYSQVVVSPANSIVTYDGDYSYPTPTRDYYDFAGWFTDEACTTAAPTSPVKITSTLPLYSKWTPHNYTVTYQDNNGNPTASTTYNIESGTLAAAATRTGYTFSNWEVVSTDGNWTVGQTYSASAATTAGLHGNVTLKPNWTANNYTLHYNNNDGDRIGTASCADTQKTVTYDSAVGTLAVPSIDGYTFDGWFTAASGGTQVTAATVFNWIDNDTTVYAHWTPITYTASFNKNGGNDVASVNYTIESTITFPGATRTGYTFVNWTTDSSVNAWTQGTNYNKAAVSTTNVKGTTPYYFGNINFTANWDDNDYTLTFDKNDTTGVGDATLDTTSKTVTYDSAIGELPTPTRTGYTFDGWFLGDTQITAATIYNVGNGFKDGNDTVKAHWTAITYTISWFEMGGTTAYETTDFTIESSITLPLPTNDGYDFRDWHRKDYDDDSNWKTKDSYAAEAVLTGMYGNVSLNKRWTLHNYTINWYNDDDTIITTTTATTTHSPNTPTSPTKDQTPQYTYTFSGWTGKAGTAIAGKTPAEVICGGPNSTIYEFTAVYTRETRKYNVKWLNEDGTTFVDNTAVENGSAIPTQTVPDKTGNTGVWKMVSGDSLVDVPAAMPTNDIVLKAYYTPNDYNVTWHINGTTSTTQVEYNTQITYDGTPTKASTNTEIFEFAGWSTTEDGEVAALPVIGAADTEFYAIFTPSTRYYTVTWNYKDADGADKSDTTQCTYNATPTHDTPAAYETATDVYTFNAWAPAISEITADAEYTAQYTSSTRKYNITWLNENGNEIETTQVANGSAVTLSAVPAKTGYTGVWKMVSGDNLVNVPATMPTNDIALKAVYTINKYKITWDIDGVKEETEWEYLSNPTYGSIPTKASDAQYDYTFSSWSPSINTVTENATYTAQFTSKVRSYTVTWISEGTELSSETYDYGSAPVFKGNTPTKASSATTDYTFSGWTPTVTSVTGNASYTAEFSESARKYTVTWITDGTVYKTADVAYGTAAETVAVPETNSHPAVGYTGAWDKTITSMPSANVTITAVYTPIPFDITWIVDGTQTVNAVPYGTTPDYGSTPTKAADSEYTYTFSNWSPTVATVTGKATYTAVFSKEAKSYTLTWKAYLNDTTHGGSIDTIVKTETVKFGTAITDVPTVPAIEGYAAAWDSIPATMPSQNYTVNAVYIYGAKTITWMVNGAAHTTTGMIGNTPSFDETPQKPADAEYTYTFAGWAAEEDGTIITTSQNGTGLPAIEDRNDITYYAVFTKEANTYSVTWIADGETVNTANVKYGDAFPSFSVPGTTSHPLVGYTGAWDKAYTTMPAENVTITASYTAKEFDIIWDVNGTKTTVKCAYDTIPEFTGSTDKAQSDTTVYTFKEWSPSVAKVTGNQTYIATYTETARPYTITYKNDDGSVLYTDTYGYNEAITARPVPTRTGYTAHWEAVPATMPVGGYTVSAVYVINTYTVTWATPSGNETETYDYNSTPSYKNETPTQASTVSTDYTFSGWLPEIAKVTGDVTYTAQFTPSTREYTVTWSVAGNNTDVQVQYGTKPEFAGSTHKDSSLTTDYTFKSWDKEVTEVTGDVTYTATYTETVRKYTITLYDEDGNAIEGGSTSVANASAIPSSFLADALAAQAKTGYTAHWYIKGTTTEFTGTTMPTNDIELQVGYTINSYKITWIDGNGNTLAVDDFDYNTTPAYTGATPTKDSTASTVYTFNGTWSPAITKVSGDATYTAQFDEAIRKYTITWNYKDADGNDTTKTTSVGYGFNPSFTEALPNHMTDTTVYTFDTWTPTIAAVSGDASYTATYTETVRTYTITWVADGRTYKTESVANGAAITAIDVPAKTGHTGAWNSVPATMPTEDITITAVYTPIKYNVTWVIPTGNVTEQFDYGTTPEFTHGTPTKATDEKFVYTFSGWSPAVTTVAGDTTYTAQFTRANRPYTISWVIDGEVKYTTTCNYSEAIDYSQVIPEREGNDGVWLRVYTTMPASDLTITASYTAREYTINWVADNKTVYTEVLSYGDAIPEKDVPAKTGFTGVWDTVPATVPADNVTIKAVYTRLQYALTWKLSAEDQGTDTVTYGIEYSRTFTGTLPEALRILVDGKTLAATGYTYDSATGTLIIYGSSVTGEISIFEQAGGGNVNVFTTASNLTMSNTGTTATLGMTYHTNLTATAGYLLPETVQVYIDGELLEHGYTYDIQVENNVTIGRLTVNAEYMTGDLEIVAAGVVDPDYNPDEKPTDDDNTKKGPFDWFLELIRKIVAFFNNLFKKN